MTKWADSIAQARANATAAPRNSGSFRLYSGTKPANVAAGLGAATLLVTGTYAATAFPSSTGAGAMTSNSITGANAVATGTPTFGASYASDGTTMLALHDPSEFTVTPSSITSGVAVTFGTITHTEAAGT